jgi:SAM-dependent methyltransferase
MLNREIIEDIAILLRGFFATPIISSLGRLGVLETMASLQSFTVNHFSEIPNKKLLQAGFRYLLRLGLLEKSEGQEEVYSASELGKEIFRRANSFYVPHSYFEYMSRFHDLIQNPSGTISCKVERLENVIGSGKTHLRYFPPVISYMKRKMDIDVLADIGCGDGQFLSAFIKSIPGKKVVGIDLAEIAVATTSANIKQQFPAQEITTVCSDALDVKKWGEEVLRVAGQDKVAISMWFLLHEISRAKPENLIDFFCTIYRMFPDAPIALGEVVCQGDDVLVKNNAKSLMPEYLFFHEMSGQGILLWPEYIHVLKNIPYELVFERLFDEALDNEGRRIPSTFVWCLTPRNTQQKIGPEEN